ncbi:MULTISPECIES: 16S rRNA (cytidine(1402)-2'-O)-methyltransferase [unclassified Colwellia]|uniref:16S rRNA (cytidine(1402)-2'-O)-methyltransferase n=1 Tax=unclassified Colwellia TaxID=196834 RepID=UPI0015F490F1|nr:MULTISPECIES: 16S rRNA (cytidine(1402)-2'-O)-methyltransferase [unclassified Colwellia]MBA6232524.1 16S rRNA (cytidine(1402)-2'-O)-methyltransferase [Colwellia sp. MB02u-7]MBA6235335.1 16S rRNA (cytidine(1402)-2'-O)-methyltransferase [Colwellia sp. MB02u-11]MBA6257842.1 16S rRNA (cytidine(1402)-2'-O)-methyltransferase [Colwellia sp. MB3u-28]MBA6258477.1 16S rRNA (cytidine(1402)-2'-O)-methyltransferase [Colwellia sp. MB3u-41]MBA6299385.1 16S rRNA (cytidine(1402)-2'-O)-methyltransferase [Colw
MSSVFVESGTLYIVATPIGNLTDISQRALDVLTHVDIIACEDTRHTQRLLSTYSIKNKTLSLHDHNERQRQDYVATLLQEGKSIALVSDAGTPLISDPGFHLVRHCRQLNLPVSPIPGACAAIAALSVAGLPTDRFSFEGFLPSKSGARQATLANLLEEPRTMVFYDAPRRAIDTVEDIVKVLGGERHVVISRELTKTFETIHSDTACNLLAWLKEDPNQLKGEMVLIIEGNKIDTNAIPAKAIDTLKLLLEEMKPKKACAITAEIYGVKKNALYEIVLSLK